MMRHVLLLAIAMCVLTMGVDIYLGLTLNTSLRWFLLAITPLPAYAAVYAFRVWLRTA